MTIYGQWTYIGTCHCGAAPREGQGYTLLRRPPGGLLQRLAAWAAGVAYLECSHCSRSVAVRLRILERPT